MVLAALLLQALLEFGPLWMVALAAPTLLFGAHWAGLMSALGIGGALAGRMTLTRPGTVDTGQSRARSLAMATSFISGLRGDRGAGACAVPAIVGTFLSRLFHDAVPSTIRAGVASGVGTLTRCVLCCSVRSASSKHRRSIPPPDDRGGHRADVSTALVHLATSRRFFEADSSAPQPGARLRSDVPALARARNTDQRYATVSRPTGDDGAWRRSRLTSSTWWPIAATQSLAISSTRVRSSRVSPWTAVTARGRGGGQCPPLAIARSWHRCVTTARSRPNARLRNLLRRQSTRSRASDSPEPARRWSRADRGVAGSKSRGSFP